MSRVLVTGGAGMIGQAIVRRLLERRPTSRCASATSASAPDWIREGAEVHTGDLRDPAQARAALDGATHVIHCAAIVGGIGELPPPALHADRGQQRASTTASSAPRSTSGVERFVYISSSMVFERAARVPDARGPPRPTACRRARPTASRSSPARSTAAPRTTQFGLPFTICRPFNAYGPGEMPTDEPGIAHAVPDLIRKVLAGQRPLQIFGSGEQTRTLTHVDDIAAGVLAALRSPAGAGRGLQHLGRARS